MRCLRSFFVLAIAAPASWLVGSCSEPAADPVATVVQPVIGGEAAAACGWPSTVRVEGCTGTLIHPRVVTTAAHCVRGDGSTARITFGPGRSGAGSFTLTGTCRAGASGQRGVNSRNDWAYCMLPDDDRVAAVPVTRPLVGCEAELFLKPGARAWVVGFGETRGTGGVNGAKNQVEVTVNQLDKLGPGTIDVGDATAGACHGDSGGPIYMQLRDGNDDYGFRVFGSTSGPGSRFGCDCTCSTTYVNIAMHVEAIEEREGIDVTPCTDADGEWDPGPECNQQLADPEHGTGTWPNCQVTRTMTPIASCGPAFVADAGKPDPVPPDAGAPPVAGNGAAGLGAAGTAVAGSGGVGASAGTGGTTAPVAGGVADPGLVGPTAGVPATPPTAPPGQAGQPSFGPSGAAAPQPAPPAVAPVQPPAASSGSSETSDCACSAVGSAARARPPIALAGLAALVPWLAARGRRRAHRRHEA